MTVGDLTLNQIKEICMKQEKKNHNQKCVNCPCMNFCYLYFYKSNGDGVAPWIDWRIDELEREVKPND